MANKNNALNINIKHTKKLTYTINGDANTTLEFDPSDLGILVRLQEADPIITQAVDELTTLQDSIEDYTDDAIINQLSEKLMATDKIIREQLDYVFDTNMSEVCAPTGTMLDPVDGEMRFLYLIDVFSEVYDEGLHSAMQKRAATIKKHTDKYTKDTKNV